MDRTFPPEMMAFVKRTHPLKVFVSDAQPVNPRDCKNCGGTEVLAVFLALRGPYQSPAAPYQRLGDVALCSHYDQNAGKGLRGGWWLGCTYTFPCPVCLDRKVTPPKETYPVQMAIGKFVHPDTEEVLE